MPKGTKISKNIHDLVALFLGAGVLVGEAFLAVHELAVGDPDDLVEPEDVENGEEVQAREEEEVREVEPFGKAAGAREARPQNVDDLHQEAVHSGVEPGNDHDHENYDRHSFEASFSENPAECQ